MKHFALLFLSLCFCLNVVAQNEEIEGIKADLSEAESSKERMSLLYDLAEAYMRVNAEEAENHAKTAYNLAKDQNNEGMAARTAYLVSKAFDRQRDERNQEVWLRTTLNHAKRARDSDLIMTSVQERGELAKDQRNERRAIQIYEEAFNYFSQNGTSISELEAQYQNQRNQIERERRTLVQERDQLEFQVRNLRLETNQLSQDKGVLEERTETLTQDNQRIEDELTTQTEELENVAEQKLQAEQKARDRSRQVQQLSEEAAKTELILKEQENAVMQADLDKKSAELKARNQEYALYGSAAAAGILLLLALLLWNRFRAKRKAAIELADKNEEIEEERKRSDELLLNILPASIATELKEKGKAKARQFSEATVLFSDFINFTKIAELLSPEELVQELDKCFKAFDFILSQYPDIEKIKTIGDAYMCASGLDGGRKRIPASIVKAALEMQAFLDEQKQERARIGKPYFEARIGLHTGPVVAGVVGLNKFAYDIWGDTVNIAARVEANSEAGRVNISETTFRLIKYQFECIYRGKVEAKNKGMLDMYFVQKELASATVA